MSIDRRNVVVDNLGWQPCIEPMLLGKLMDRLCEGRTPTAIERIGRALANLRKKLAR